MLKNNVFAGSPSITETYTACQDMIITLTVTVRLTRKVYPLPVIRASAMIFSMSMILYGFTFKMSFNQSSHVF